MSAALSVVFTGLCALVTGGNNGSGQVLLVDAQGIGEVGGVVLPEHTPTLVTSLKNLANADSSSPTRVVVAAPGGGSAGSSRGATTAAAEQIGIWDLRGTEVRIRVQAREAAGLDVYRPSRGESSWPAPPRDFNNPNSWRDIRFVANMQALAGDGRVEPALIRDDGNAGPLPRSVAARIHLEGGRVEAGIPSQEIFRGEMFEFRDARGEPKLRQALTDTLRWTVEAGAGPVVVEITPVAGGPVKRLVFASSEGPHNLFVSNLPAENANHDIHHAAMLSDDQAAALHFGAYYKLLIQEPPDPALPSLWHAAVAHGSVGLVNNQICPPAWFDQQ